jgi:hypothetical protein
LALPYSKVSPDAIWGGGAHQKAVLIRPCA